MSHSLEYTQTVEYLFGLLPLYQRIGEKAYKKKLTNIIHLCEHLNEPQTHYRTIHVAGTNGKGSVSSLLASVLNASGYKTGLYTSPHLHEFTERIRIDGVEIAQQEVVEFVERMKPVIEELRPSFFELTVVMAFDHFARHKVDVAVIEVGLGGRLDSTNIISPEISVITNISLDHQNVLGETLAEIAGEKAGIIKENTPVVIGKRQVETTEVYQTIAQELDAPLYFAENQIHLSPLKSNIWGHVFEYSTDTGPNEQINCPLAGDFQLENFRTVISASEILNTLGFRIQRDHLRTGFHDVYKRSGLRGRLSILHKIPLVICDIAHNTDALTHIFNFISQIKRKTLRIVFGASSNKDLQKMMVLLPKEAEYYLAKANVPRGTDKTALLELFKDSGLLAQTYPTVENALENACTDADTEDLILVTGSAFVVAEIIDFPFPNSEKIEDS